MALMVQRDDNQDVGSDFNDMSSQQLGTAQAVFPTPSSTAIPSASATIPFTTTTSTSISGTSQPSAISGHHTLSRQNANVLIIIGSIVAAVALFAIILLVIRSINKRRLKEAKRWTFHPDRMTQDRQSPSSIAQTSRGISRSTTIPLGSQDLEEGVPAPVIPPMHRSNQNSIVHPASLLVGPRGPGPALRRLELTSPRGPLPPLPITPKSSLIPRSPLTPRSSLPRSPGVVPFRVISPGLTRSPIPRSPSPRTHRQRAIADQIEMLRIQMLQFERLPEKDDGDGDTTMREMSKKMAWLREQQEGSWALGLTEVTPLGYDRYMI